MIRNEMLNIFEETWPTILISVVILVTMRLMYLIKNKQKIIVYKELLSLMFVIYALCLFYVVTYGDVSYSSANFIPFKEMFRYKIGSRLFIKNVVGNMILFMPFGFFASYYLKLEKPTGIIFLSLIVSITIECTQSLIGRIFDIDDIILNVVGSTLGFYIYYILNKIKKHLPDFLKNQILYNIVVIVMLVIMIAYLIGVFEI